MFGNQTKHCDQLAAAAMQEGSHFESLEAVTWGELLVKIFVELFVISGFTQGEEDIDKKIC